MFSRIEPAHNALHASVDLHEVAEEVVADVLRRAQEESKPMEVSFEADESLRVSWQDPERIRQILWKPGRNAL